MTPAKGSGLGNKRKHLIEPILLALGLKTFITLGDIGKVENVCFYELEVVSCLGGLQASDMVLNVFVAPSTKSSCYLMGTFTWCHDQVRPQKVRDICCVTLSAV